MIPSNPSITAWLIDLDGTLYSPKPVQLAMAAELLLSGPHRISLLQAFRRHHESLRHELGLSSDLEFLPSPFDEQLRRTADKEGVDVKVLRQLVNGWMMARPGKWLRLSRRRRLLSAIGEFRMRGGKTAIVSDYPAEQKLAALGCRQLFDLVVSNGEHPRLTRLKPAPDGMQIAADELGVLASECLVIGDREDADGAAARAAGMSFHLIR